MQSCWASNDGQVNESANDVIAQSTGLAAVVVGIVPCHRICFDQCCLTGVGCAGDS